MKDQRVCVKYLFEESTNITRYSWFERSNLVPYEPGMRRRVVHRHPSWQSVNGQATTTESQTNGKEVAIGNTVVTPNEDTPKGESMPVEWPSTDQEMDTDGDFDVVENPSSPNLPIVLVEHRWSFMLPKKPQVAQPFDMMSPRHWFDGGAQLGDPEGNQVDNNVENIEKTEITDHNQYKPNNTLVGCDKNAGVRDAFSSVEFGGRSSVLRCLLMNLEPRYISRTQMNYSFHLSAIAERVIQEGVYYIANISDDWNPVICSEPIDMHVTVQLHEILKGAIEECRVDNDLNADQEDSKYQKVSETNKTQNNAAADGHLESDKKDMVYNTQSPFSYPLMDLRYLSMGAAILGKFSYKTMKSIYDWLSKRYPNIIVEAPCDDASGMLAKKDTLHDRLIRLIKKIGGERCPDSTIVAIFLSLIRSFAKPVDVSNKINMLDTSNNGGNGNQIGFLMKVFPFEHCREQRREPNCDYNQRYCASPPAVTRLCLCSSKYVLCPTVFNEYIVFGGSPATQVDMELGVWIFDSPFTRIKMRDVPVVYHQQTQYSTRKYVSTAELKDAMTSARVLNLRMEFCGRGDWVFDDGSYPSFEGEKERPVYGKVITADDLMQLEFTGTVNQIAKKFFLLQKASLGTGKEGTSRLIFMEPYANIDASICEDKDYLDSLVNLLASLYNQNPESFLASCNGYYYHEDGFLPESLEIQRLRNQLFNLESSHYRTAMLADIIQDQKLQLNLTQKMPFLTKCKRVIMGKSHIHGYGLFAVDTINKGELILEYAGVVISDHMADLRENLYDRLLCGSIYMFRLDLNHIIDSTFYGNCARFINHSCDPNTATTNFSCIDEDGFGTHVGIYASKVIPAGEEIYYNYRLSSGSANREVCHCGSYMCTGYMSLVK
ncbi:SET domain containing protein [Babesia gibsoni]|uniref:SET domain containing protein n=1 Tax=Babesia gibsoni TaxID=33632 RepID=A0AAD8UVJ6_BABGI|nr:SET domain containing protein [Babesia gibsoni]